jgi:hypothetical protein
MFSLVAIGSTPLNGNASACVPFQFKRNRSPFVKFYLTVTPRGAMLSRILKQFSYIVLGA